MPLVVEDDYVDIDTLIGPLPRFDSSFDKFFIEKAANLLFEPNSNDLIEQKVVLNDSNDLEWMYRITLAKNQQQQNLEIIYNNNNVYFKTIHKLFRDDELYAFPSKDLEISLGLQFVPLNKCDNYTCKKCSMTFNHQNHLMLHMRYFCQATHSSLKRKLNSSDADESASTLHNQAPTNWLQSFRNEKRNNPIMSYFHNLINSTATYNAFGNNSTLLEAIQKKPHAYQLPPSTSMNGLVNLANANQYDLIRAQQKSMELHSQALNYKEILSQLANFANKLNGPQVNAGENNGQLQETAQSSSEKAVFRRPAPMRCKSPIAFQSNKGDSELNRTLNAQTLQNWCAKCNSHFRLTSDLVYHMRTFHRKDETPIQESGKAPLASLPRTHKASPVFDESELESASKTKCLRCLVCLEVFKEKHHLSRHMTSHR